MLKNSLKRIYNRVGLLAQSVEDKTLVTYKKNNLEELDISSKSYSEALANIKQVDQENISPSDISSHSIIVQKGSKALVGFTDKLIRMLRK